MKKVSGIVFSNMHDHMVKEMTTNRCMGSLPVGGRYRLVDFVLSGFSHAGISNVSVIAKVNYKSLLDHLGNGREWDLARKKGGLIILPPAALSDTGAIYSNRIEALSGIMSLIHNSESELMLIADCDIMANIDYTDFINCHNQSGADITVMYKKQYLDGAPARDRATFSLDAQNNVTGVFVNPDMSGEHNEYLNIMVISRDLLEWIIKDCLARGLSSFDRDVLQANIGRFSIKAYEFTQPCFRFGSVKAYYDSNLALLQPELRKSIFRADRPIFTRIKDEAPVRYGLNAHVANALLADGCEIEGEVENSLLFRGVKIGKGAKVRNCILMEGTDVGDGCTLDCVVTDRRVLIRDNRSIMGVESYPMYIKKGAVV